MTAKVLLLTLSCLILSASSASLDGKVIGGVFAAPGQFPHQVSIQLKQQHHCGGSIIGPRIILTAAQCVYGIDANDLSVVAGTIDLLAGDGVVSAVESYVCHENFKQTSNDMDYDIALVLLTQPYTYGNFIRPIPLPPPSYSIKPGPAHVSGFGMFADYSPQSPYLKWAILNVEPNSKCEQYENYNERMICAASTGRPNACPGDNGGPLEKSFFLVGVVSWGLACENQGASVYTSVTVHRLWILFKTGI